ncbi:hypothetical protein HDV05_002613 [Chytridiales sp. JEL 0842]|nr:hypothetical protein HDV05_002613 [Chytridiales sp. JEL 0842]
MTMDGNKDERLSFCIVGGGFGGINSAIQIKKKFPDAQVTLYEKGDSFGGTWYWNKYPGCQCDIPSHFYSLSYELNPDWPHHYSSREHIRNYLESVAKKHNLYDIAILNTKVESLTWDAPTSTWQVVSRHIPTDTLHPPRSYTYVFLSIGPLHVPKIPDFPGLKDFKGIVMHSAEWDESFKAKGLKVGVVGTGASAVQIVPQIQQEQARASAALDEKKKEGSLVVFQRSAAWVPKKVQYSYSPLAKVLFKWVPFLMRLWRWWIMFGTEFQFFVAFFKKPILRNFVQNQIIKSMQEHIKDPILQQKFIPDYPLGAHRVTPSNTWFRTFAQPNVTLETDPISHLTSDSLVTRSGTSHKLDALILATGFQVRDVLDTLKITGVNNADLSTTMGDCPQAYYSCMNPAFPNFFHVLGPNSGFGHYSVVHMIEQQTRWVLNLVALAREKGYKKLQVKKEAFERYNQFIQDGFKDKVWSLDRRSWYNNEKGVNFTLWPFSGSYVVWFFSRRPRLEMDFERA